MCKIRTRGLLAVNGLMWAAIGTKITVTGVSSYWKLGATDALWWMIPLSLLVFAGFYRMFTGVVRKYSERIYAMPEPKTSVFKTFSVKGYLIIAFMISLGIALKHIPGIPTSFFAWFYCGLGPGLLSAGVRFLLRWWRARTQSLQTDGN
ncbi:MAG: hypothetical protein J5702_05960 [Bacteroidales bacterium]|nr:hypothetical protein [Bacteroidales bacterium]